MWTYFRSHLGWKIFFSYLVVIGVGIIILLSATEFVIPRAFDRHVAAMASMMMGMMGDMVVEAELNANLFDSFRDAMWEAITFAGIAATAAAIAVSLFISRQVVAPIRDMMRASKYIADGHYDQRVQVPGDPARDELDELAQLALSFNQMAEKLSRTESMRLQLIGDVAHELRTPLTTIKGYMEGLIDGVLPDELEIYQQVLHEADRLQRLVYDLQELSRVEAGAYEMHLQAINVQDLIEDAASRLRRQYEDKGVELSSNVPEDLPQVRVDKYRIDQVMINLLGNALQYTPSGGKVNISAAQQNGEILISIRDTGMGISSEHLPMLFTRFYRVDKSRSRAGGGSGIGLTISKFFVEAHGGRIWAESDGIDKGSTFRFTLPV
jgi:histidine kinase